MALGQRLTDSLPFPFPFACEFVSLKRCIVTCMLKLDGSVFSIF